MTRKTDDSTEFMIQLMSLVSRLDEMKANCTTFIQTFCLNMFAKSRASLLSEIIAPTSKPLFEDMRPAMVEKHRHHISSDCSMVARSLPQ